MAKGKKRLLELLGDEEEEQEGKKGTQGAVTVDPDWRKNESATADPNWRRSDEGKPSGKERLKRLMESDDDTPANRESKMAAYELAETGSTNYRGKAYNLPAGTLPNRQKRLNAATAGASQDVAKLAELALGTAKERDDDWWQQRRNERSARASQDVARMSRDILEEKKEQEPRSGLRLPEIPKRTNGLNPGIEAEFQRRNSAQGPNVAPGAWAQSQIAEANRRDRQRDRYFDQTESGWKNVGTTLGGMAAKGISELGGAPLIAMARIMEMPDDLLYRITGNERFNLDREPGLRDSAALRASDPFAEEAERASEKVGDLGKQLIQTAGAAGSMIGWSGFLGPAFQALGNAGTLARLSNAAESSPLLTSAASRRGAKIALDVLTNPGNFGISLGSAVNSYDKAYAEGANFEQAVANGLYNGLAEYMSNKLFSGTPLEDNPGEKGYVTRLVESITKDTPLEKVLVSFNKSTGGKLFNWAMDKAGEGLEEVITGIADPLIEKLTYNWSADLATAKDLVDEFAGGILLSLLMSGGEAVMNRIIENGAVEKSRVVKELVAMGVDRATANRYAKQIADASSAVLDGSGWLNGEYNDKARELMGNADYAEKSQGKQETADKAAGSDSESLNRYADIYYRENAVDELRRGAEPASVSEAAYLNELEARNYFYIWESQGPKAADAYYDSTVKASVQNRQARAEAEYQARRQAEERARAQAVEDARRQAEQLAREQQEAERPAPPVPSSMRQNTETGTAAAPVQAGPPLPSRVTQEQASRAETPAEQERAQGASEAAQETPTERKRPSAKQQSLAQQRQRQTETQAENLRERGFTTAGEDTVAHVRSEATWDAEEKAVAAALREQGIEPTFVTGLLKTAEGKRTTAILEGNRLAIQADNRSQTVQSIAEKALGKTLNVDPAAFAGAAEAAITARTETKPRSTRTVSQRAQATLDSARQYGVSDEDANTAARLADVLGKDIRFYSKPGSDSGWENGYTEDGVIYVNAAAKARTVTWVIGHELTHNTEHAKIYQALQKLAKQYYGSQWQNRIDSRVAAGERMAKAKGNDGYRLSPEAAAQELTADYFAEKVLTDEATIRQIVKNDAPTARRIVSYLKNLLQKLKGKEPTIERAIDLYSRALKQAAQEAQEKGRKNSLTLPSREQYQQQTGGLTLPSRQQTAAGKQKTESRLELPSRKQYSAEDRQYSAEDSEYLAAVNSGDMETAQRMVDEAAKAAGYVTAAYHGTGESFNSFRRGYEGIHLGTKSQAEQIANRRYEDRSKETIYKWGDVREKIGSMNETSRKELVEKAWRLVDDYSKFPANSGRFKGDINDDAAIREYVDRIAGEYARIYRKKSADDVPMRLNTFDRKTGRRVMQLLAKISNPMTFNGDIVEWSPDNIANAMLERAKGKDRYEFFDNYYDITGSDYTLTEEQQDIVRQIAEMKIKGEDAWDELGEVLGELGFDGIKYRNEFEGDKNSYSYIALRPSDVKSADPVTYDDNGKVIPLSERFNPEEKDIRYSVEDSEYERELGSRSLLDTPALKKLGVRVSGSVGQYGKTESMIAKDRAAKSLQREARKAEKRLKATDAEKEFANGIAAGIYSEEDIPKRMNKDTVMELADYYFAENSANLETLHQLRSDINQGLRDEAQELLEDADIKPQSMLLLNERTPERSFRAMFGDRAEEITKWMLDPVRENEAEKIRWYNKQMDAVRTFKDSKGKTRELTRAESALTMRVMEGRAAADMVAAMETRAAIENAAQNIRNGEDPGDAAMEFSLSAGERDLAEKYAGWLSVQEELKTADSTIVEAAAEKYAQIFDDYYDAINDFLVAHGYEPIGYIKGYAPHMQPEENQSLLQKAFATLGINEEVSQLPASIAGMTTFFKPNKRWNPYFLQRTGDTAEYDIVKAYQSYVDYMADILYHTDDVMRIRQTANWIRKTYAPEEIRANLDWAQEMRNASTEEKQRLLRDAGEIGQNTVLSPVDTAKAMQDYIDKLYQQIADSSKNSNLVMWLDNYANILAGKQSFADRGWEYSTGRKSLNWANRLNNVFQKANVAGNLSSILNQTAQLPMIYAELGERDFLGAMADIVGGKTKSWAQDSDFLTAKEGKDLLYTDNADKFIDALYKPASWMDHLVSTVAVRGAFNKAARQGKSYEQAMRYADDFGRKLMGSRAKGSRPLAYESKGFFSKMVHMFQIEAVNSWDHLATDLPYEIRQIAKTDGKDKAARALAALVIRALLGAFVLNRLTDELYGGTPAPFDVLGLAANFVASGKGLSTNQYIRTIIDNSLEKMGAERIFDTEKKTKEDFDLDAAAEELIYNVMNDIPLIRNAAGVMGLGDQTVPLPGAGGEFKNLATTAKALLKDGREEGEVANLIKAAILAGLQFVSGGRQLSKTAQGAEALIRGGSYSGYKNPKLQYPLEGAADTAKALLFGKNATGAAKDYWAAGGKALTEKQTALYQSMVDEGMSRREAFETITGHRTEGTLDDYVKWTESRSRDAGTGEDLYLQFRADTKDITGDPDGKGGTISGSKKQKIVDYIDSLEDLTPDQKTAMLLDYNSTYSLKGLPWLEGAPAEPQVTKPAAEPGSPVAAEPNKPAPTEPEKVTKMRGTLTELGLQDSKVDALAPVLGGDGSNTAKWRAVADQNLGKSQQDAVLREIMTDSMYRNWTIASGENISLDDYVTGREAYVDLDNSGTDQNGEWTAALEQVTFDKDAARDNYIKGILWQIYTGSTSTKNNPFDKTAGQKVLDAKTGGGGKSGGDKARIQLPTQRQPWEMPTRSKLTLPSRSTFREQRPTSRLTLPSRYSK